MITNSLAGDFLLWTFFWIVVAGALVGLLLDVRTWLQQDTDAREGMQNHPAESLGEPGPEQPASSHRPPDKPRS